MPKPLHPLKVTKPRHKVTKAELVEMVRLLRYEQTMLIAASKALLTEQRCVMLAAVRLSRMADRVVDQMRSAKKS